MRPTKRIESLPVTHLLLTNIIVSKPIVQEV
jgi:hypothetical protein